MPVANVTDVNMFQQPNFLTTNINDYNVMPYMNLHPNPMGSFTYPFNPQQ